jgi:hypothetical protein
VRRGQTARVSGAAADDHRSSGPRPASRRPLLNKVLGVAALVLLAAGSVFALRPVSVDGIDCGSVFQPATGITPMDCDNRVGDRGTVAATLGGAGLAAAVMSIGIAVLRDRRASKTTGQ